MTDPQPPIPAPGTREIRLEVEVPGTPEEVWAAIGTGPGITAWFVPAEVADGQVRLEFMTEQVETGRVAATEAPHRFAYTAPESGDRILAYEWLVEEQAGGTCLVRLVNTGFGPGADWDGDYHGMSQGWPMFLENLRLYLTHFRGLAAVAVHRYATVPQPVQPAWEALTDALGLPATAAVGDRVAVTAADAPPLAGTVESADTRRLTVRLTEPGPGLALLTAEGWAGSSMLSVMTYHYGPDAAATADRVRPAWGAWMDKHFPAESTG